MKSWHVIVLSLSLIVCSIVYKYEPENKLDTDSGTVNLGKIYSERVLVDISLLPPSSSATSLADSSSFFTIDDDVLSSMNDYVDHLNFNKKPEEKLSYENISPSVDGFKLKVRTYIEYRSANFSNVPFNLTIYNHTYDLLKGKPLKSDIEFAIAEAKQKTTPNLKRLFFITDIKQFVK